MASKRYYDFEFDAELRAKKYQELKERINKKHNSDTYLYPSGSTSMASVCYVQQYYDNNNFMAQGCASVSPSYVPQIGRHDDWDKTGIEFFREENRRYLKTNAELRKEIVDLRHENSVLKAKKEKKQIKINRFVNAKTELSVLIKKIIIWFNN